MEWNKRTTLKWICDVRERERENKIGNDIDQKLKNCFLIFQINQPRQNMLIHGHLFYLWESIIYMLILCCANFITYIWFIMCSDQWWAQSSAVQSRSPPTWPEHVFHAPKGQNRFTNRQINAKFDWPICPLPGLQCNNSRPTTTKNRHLINYILF